MRDYSRREFIKIAGLSAAALTLPNFIHATSKSIPEVGIQLYTVRNDIEKNFEYTIRYIADIGFRGVETYFFPNNISLNYAAKIIKDAGLTILGSHCELPVGKDRTMMLKMADIYKTDRMIYHGWPQDEKYEGMDAIKKTVELYNEISVFAKSNGIKFGLHNHWWEFQEKDGIIPFYYLLENLNPDIFFEIDTYWTKTAGLDPAKVIKDFGIRVPLLHIKDGSAPKGKPVHQQEILGEGTLNFPEIIEAGGENTKWLIVEFDEYKSGILPAVRKSFKYLVLNGLGRGKYN